MAASMTGFGRAAVAGPCGRVTVEMKSVNHRYLDLTTKLPRELSFVDPLLREKVKAALVRGKVDVAVSFDASSDDTLALHFNPKIAEAYVRSALEASEEFNLTYDLTASRLIGLPYVMETETVERDEESLKALFSEAMDGALAAFTKARETEGSRLVADLSAKVTELSSLVESIEERIPRLIEGYKARLTERLAEFSESDGIDSNRLAQEVTLFADKIAIDEEVVRLKSHIAETLATLKGEGEIGRRLDFLSQEMNREANTILSKSTDVETDRIGVQMKTLIEKIREQIQNLE